MQPPAITLTHESAARTTGRRARSRRYRTCGSAPRRVSRLDRRDNLALLERHCRLLHDRFVPAQPGLDVDGGPEVTAEHHRLKVQLVSLLDERQPRALRVEHERAGRNPPVRAGGPDLEGYADERTCH